MRWLVGMLVVAALVAARPVLFAEDLPTLPPFKGDAAANKDAKDDDAKKVDTSKLSPKELKDLKAKTKQLLEIAKQLKAARKAEKGGRVSPDDFFLVGKVELGLKDRTGSVGFETIQGQNHAVKAIAEYLNTAPPDTARYFQAFARFRSEETAAAGLTEIQQKWDEYKSYREQLAARYNANITCRT
ncbi:MAG: hypothetical protein HYS13_24720 [Planctomycetia bacterium]|nr:hypothetical protein [Planctomycetia bacterium]